MRFSQKMAEKVAKPIADMLYQKGFRKLDEVLAVVQETVFSSSLDESIKCELYTSIECAVKEHKYE